MGWQVAEEDLKRVAAATGGVVQSTVNNLNPKVLGTCADFEEVQVSLSAHPTMPWQGLLLCAFPLMPKSHWCC